MFLKFQNTYERALSNASNYRQWTEAAKRYDKAFQLEQWKRLEQSDEYDYLSIRSRLDKLRVFRARQDNQNLLFTLNEGIHGNMGGMGRESLYKTAKFGTKFLIEQYIDEIDAALSHLASEQVEDISFSEKIDFLHRASHCFGRSALMLSGAGTLLFFHLGVVKALWEQDLLPSIISGASGGALIAALVGTHTEDELVKIFDAEYLRMEADRDVNLLRNFSLFKSKQMPIDEVRSHMNRLIPDITFQEAHELTGRHINISIAPLEKHQTSRLLNATTSPNVMIREAVLASCAAPGFYPPVTLLARNSEGEKQAYLPSRQWIDGSFSEDLPMKRLSRLYGVNHCIVSQTNPIALPFIDHKKEQNNSLGIIRHSSLQTVKEWTIAGSRLIQNRMKSDSLGQRAMKTFTAIVSQNYTGDINILPPKRLHNPINVLSPRTRDEILSMIYDGERSTWPQIETIRLQTKISRGLDKILKSYDPHLLEIANY